VIRNERSGLERLLLGLEAFFLGRGVSTEVFSDVRLGVDEAVSNIIRHGDTDAEGHEIRVRVTHAGGEVVLEIEDDARPFNPLDVPTPDLSLPVEDKPAGGLGVHLIRSVMDHVEYRRSGDRNFLRLRRRTGR